MTESIPLFPQMDDTASEERITAARCPICARPIKHGQITSGVRLTPEVDEVFGHYACVVQALGPEKTLTAILTQKLPAIDINTLVDGRVPGWERLFGDDPR